MSLNQYLFATREIQSIDCDRCNLSRFCIPRPLNSVESDALKKVVRRHRVLKKGESLYYAGDLMKGLFAVRSGSVKLLVNDPKGHEHIVDFLLPGELLGFDGLAGQRHTCSAIALETVSYCELPAQQIEVLSREVPSLVLLLLQQSGSQFNRNLQQIILGRKSAEQRLAAFLVNLSDRYRDRGFAALDFRVTMSRQEIGNYLGLALETVSRLLGQFEAAGLIRVQSKLIHIANLEGLLLYFQD